MRNTISRPALLDHAEQGRRLFYDHSFDRLRWGTEPDQTQWEFMIAEAADLMGLGAEGDAATTLRIEGIGWSASARAAQRVWHDDAVHIVVRFWPGMARVYGPLEADGMRRRLREVSTASWCVGGAP